MAKIEGEREKTVRLIKLEMKKETLQQIPVQFRGSFKYTSKIYVATQGKI